MRVVCSYCEKGLGDKEPVDDPAISHSICPACRDHFRRQWRGMSLGEYLDAFPGPVVVVDEDLRTIAANQPMAELLGRRLDDVVGLRGGEALECAHARRPGGCGKSVHCRTCTIRNSVTTTYETGEPCLRVPATVERPEGALACLISTCRRGAAVQVVIEPLGDVPTVPSRTRRFPPRSS